MYGIYTIVMKKRIGSESRVNMQLFFGLVGLFNTFLIWPGFLILHFTGVERFALPPTDRIWMIIVVCSPYTLPLGGSLFVELTSPTSDKLPNLPRLRHLLGLRHAPNHPPRRHRRPKPDNPPLPNRPNLHPRPLFQRNVLDRSRGRFPLLRGR